MSIINLERDMFWPTELTRSAVLTSAFTGAVASVGANAAVGQRVNSFQSVNFGISASGSFSASGALILPAVDGDVTPYRFIGAGPSIELSSCYWAYGYYDAGSVGGCVIFDAGGQCDRVVAVTPLDSGDPLYGQPLCFFGAVFGGSAASGCILSGSVQRLVSKPPQYASAVS